VSTLTHLQLKRFTGPAQLFLGRLQGRRLEHLPTAAAAGDRAFVVGGADCLL
jgi:hypothetical protein